MAIYQTSTLGTDTNQIVFNDYDNPSPAIYRVVSRAPQRRNVRDLDIPIPFESGVSDFQTLIGSTYYVIEGIMYPESESGYDAGLAKLRKLASLDIQQNDVLSDFGYVPYTMTEEIYDKRVNLKVLYVDIREDTRKGLVQPFRLVCKIKDPTIYSEELYQATTVEGAFGTSTGASSYPFEYPIIYGASTTTVSANANNRGDIPVFPVAINIYGPISTPRITNLATGEYIEVATNLVSVSNVLSISYDKDSLRVETDGVSVLNLVSTSSTYFKLIPESNPIELTGASVGDDAYATVSYRSGWPLS